MDEFVLHHINKNMGEYGTLADINLTMQRGERICLLGPSGCGKTTLLRVAAGLEQPDSGDVIFRGHSVKNLAPHLRNFGMMFQDFALFPHRNIFDNIAFGLEMHRTERAEKNRRVAEMLELVNLEGYGHRSVDELSGGERQRVALARTLAPSPNLVMLDEPLGSLDRLLRERLLADLCHILTKTGVSTIFVTHDQNEAFAAADRICIMIQGRIQQIDTPERLYNHPENRQVADFLGFQNLLQGESKPDNEGCVTDQGCFFPVSPLPCSGLFDLLILPWAAIPMARNDWLPLAHNRLSGRVKDLFFQGSVTRLVIETANDHLFAFDIPSNKTLPSRGEMVFLGIDPDGLRLIQRHRGRLKRLRDFQGNGLSGVPQGF